MTKALVRAQDEPLPMPDDMPALTFTPDVEAVLAEHQDKRPDVELLIRQARWQSKFWQSDVSTTGEEVAAESMIPPVQLAEVREALAVVLDPERFQIRRFLNDLVGADGNIAATVEAYDRRDIWEAANKPLNITDADAAPYKAQLEQLFCKIVDQVKGNLTAQAVMKRMLDDFASAPEIKLKAWLIRMIIDKTAPNDMVYMQRRDAVRADPAQAEELIDAFLNGLAPRLTSGVGQIKA